MEKMAREYSAYFRKYPYIYSSAVVIIGAAKPGCTSLPPKAGTW